MNYLVLNVREYNFKDDDKKTVEGATITYLDLDNEPEKDEKGFAPLSLSATTEQAKDFTTVPGFYDMQFKQRRGAQNRGVRLIFVGARLVLPVDFGGVIDSLKSSNL